MKYISLGYFCSVAMDLEKMGLRSESSPFDWLISDFEGVIRAMENGFADFLNYDDLSQNKAYRTIYKNTRYTIDFYHDFDSLIPLADQLPQVESKYRRRIDRFYESIKEPTLFIRYISDEELVDGKSRELLWIEDNFDRIMGLIRSFNPENDILFMANTGVTSEKFHIYTVEKDKGDAVARSPLFKCSEVHGLLSTADFPDRAKNLERYRKHHNPLHRYTTKIKALFKKYFLKEYVHTLQH